MNSFLKQAIVAITLLISTSAISAMDPNAMVVSGANEEASVPLVAYAAAHADVAEVKRLIKAGADVNKAGYNPSMRMYKTALDFAHIAAEPFRYGRRPETLEIIAELKKAGAKTAAELGLNPNEGETPLDIAKRKNNPEMINALKSYGAQ